MSDKFEQTTEQAMAFQKIWMESFAKTMQAAFASTPNPPPPEVLRQIRSGIFQALAQSWEEYMRSPQFLEGMKQWMEQAVAFRKMTNDFMASVRTELQSPSRGDIADLMLTMRHMEKRVLDRVEELSGRLNELNQRLPNGQMRAHPTGATTAGQRASTIPPNQAGTPERKVKRPKRKAQTP
jgi:hypothetical protein